MDIYIHICKVFSATLWARLSRQITMGWCWPLRRKLGFLSPQRREDRGVSREVFSPVGSRPGLAPGCSANSSSPLSDPHLILHSLLDASLPGWCGPNKPLPSGQRGNGTVASWASTWRPSTTLQTNSAVGHKPRATWNLSLPAVHGWFTPQNPSQAKGLNVYYTWLRFPSQGIRESLFRINRSSAYKAIPMCLFTPNKYVEALRRF